MGSISRREIFLRKNAAVARRKKRRATSAFVRRTPWLWGRKKRLAAAASCLETNGWTIEHVTPKELHATRLRDGINHDLMFRPPEKPVMGWTAYEPPSEGQRPPPIPECFREFMG